MHPDIIAYYERWDPEKLKQSQPVKAVKKNYDPREAKELNRSAYEAYLKRWGPEKPQKSQPKDTAKDILDKFGSKPVKPKGRKKSGKKLTPQKVKPILWVGERVLDEGIKNVKGREIEVSIEAKNKINRIAEIIDKLNEKAPSGGYNYTKTKFDKINYFEERLSKFLLDATKEEIDEKMKQISWEGMNTEYGYNGNIDDFASKLVDIANDLFGIELKDTANGSDIFNMEGLI